MTEPVNLDELEALLVKIPYPLEVGDRLDSHIVRFAMTENIKVTVATCPRQRVNGDGSEAKAVATLISTVVNALPTMIAELRGLRGALTEAAKSLRTLANAGDGLEDRDSMRGYANSRACVAEDALGATKKRGPAE